MSLLLVRHGQASAGAADYDCLSELGVEQCRRLGRWLASTGHRFDAVVAGRMQRHAQSAAALAEGYAREGGGSLPPVELEPGFDEFDHRAVFENYSRSRAEREEVRRAAEQGIESLAPLIRAALAAWAQDAIAGVPESWRDFGARVRGAGERLAAREHAHVLVMTSGGVASRLAQAALGAPDRAAIALNLSLRNSGLSEFHRDGDGLALGSWNAVPHLHDARELWTYY